MITLCFYVLHRACFFGFEDVRGLYFAREPYLDHPTCVKLPFFLMKSKAAAFRSTMTDAHLSACLRPATTCYTPDNEKLATSSPCPDPIKVITPFFEMENVCLPYTSEFMQFNTQQGLEFEAGGSCVVKGDLKWKRNTEPLFESFRRACS